MMGNKLSFSLEPFAPVVYEEEFEGIDGDE